MSFLPLSDTLLANAHLLGLALLLIVFTYGYIGVTWNQNRAGLARVFRLRQRLAEERRREQREVEDSETEKEEERESDEDTIVG